MQTRKSITPSLSYGQMEHPSYLFTFSGFGRPQGPHPASGYLRTAPNPTLLRSLNQVALHSFYSLWVRDEGCSLHSRKMRMVTIGACVDIYGKVTEPLTPQNFEIWRAIFFLILYKQKSRNRKNPSSECPIFECFAVEIGLRGPRGRTTRASWSDFEGLKA